MPYQKTQWKDHIEGVQTGTPVNAANLNNMEEGIANLTSIASGTNSRGTWMRYPNGLMICWGQATAVNAGGNAHAGAMWTYPVPFTQIPIVIANAVLDSSAGATVWVGGKTTTQVGLHATNGSSVTRDIPIDVIAVGVWR